MTRRSVEAVAKADPAVRAADWAARAAVAMVPGPTDEVYAVALGAAWEALAAGRARSWSTARLVAVSAARASRRSRRTWVSDSHLRHGVSADVMAWAAVDIHERPDDFVAAVSGDAPSEDLVTLRRLLAEVVDRLVVAGLDREAATAAVEMVIDAPPTHPRVEAALRRDLVAEVGFERNAARALVILLMGYPRLGVPGLLERELRGEPGWSHPCVDRLIDVIAHPRPDRLSQVWSTSSPVLVGEEAA